MIILVVPATAKPLNLNNYTTPVIGELVQVIQSVDNNYYPDLGGNITNTNIYYQTLILPLPCIKTKGLRL